MNDGKEWRMGNLLLVALGSELVSLLRRCLPFPEEVPLVVRNQFRSRIIRQQLFHRLWQMCPGVVIELTPAVSMNRDRRVFRSRRVHVDDVLVWRVPISVVEVSPVLDPSRRMRDDDDAAIL